MYFTCSLMSQERPHENKFHQMAMSQWRNVVFWVNLEKKSERSNHKFFSGMRSRSDECNSLFLSHCCFSSWPKGTLKRGPILTKMGRTYSHKWILKQVKVATVREIEIPDSLKLILKIIWEKEMEYGGGCLFR